MPKVTLTEICREINNWFERGIYPGNYTISSGEIELAGSNIKLLAGQYFRIKGSVLNDGVYQYPCKGLKDEEFKGFLCAMAIPPDVINLSEEINLWCNKYSEIINSPYQSESFKGYTYTRSTQNGSGSADALTWQMQFRSRLNKWRKL